MDKYKAKRIRNGFYIYRGYEIHCIGYYQPEHKVVWEAVDENGCGFAHSYSLRDTKMFIDEEINRIKKKMKEHKIGEIFEYNGEWYQCVEHRGCHGCAFALSHGLGLECGFNGDPHCVYRSDGKHVIFKKLEKVGDPFITNGKKYQRYITHVHPYILNELSSIAIDDSIVLIEIKQTKEDMEQEIEYFGDENAKCFNSESIKKNLKPFNLDAAKQGKPVCTRDGCKARIICFDRKDNTPIVALIERVDGIEILQCFYNDGKCFHDSTSDNDLMMLPEKKEGWVNVYKGIDGVIFSKHPYTSKDEAIKKSGILFGRIDTIKVSWEE